MISVERAKFEMKGSSYDPTRKPKKLGKKELEKVQRRKDKLLAWIPDQVGYNNKLVLGSISRDSSSLSKPTFLYYCCKDHRG